MIEHRGSPGVPDTFQVYTHFPYCRASCRFCMYYHRVPAEPSAYDGYARHIEALCGQFSNRFGRISVASAYFGGGTPSALSADALDRTARAFRSAFDVAGSFTCEAHPNTLDETKIAALVAAGVNRASMGLQSLDEHVLQVIGRHNRPLSEVAALVRFAQSHGVCVNVDLVAGLPEQTLQSLRDDIARVVDLGADEITVYRYQPVTQLPTPPAADMAYRSVFTLPLLARAVKAGYLPYIPNPTAHSARLYRAGPAWRRLRELGMWKLRDAAGLTSSQPPGYWEFSHTRSHIIGLGTGAVSHIYGRAWFREVTALDAVPATPTHFGSSITVEDECRQELLASLHERRWCNVRRLRSVTGVDLRGVFADAFGIAETRGAFEWRGGSFRLKRGTSPSTRDAIVDSIAPAPPTASPRRLSLVGVESALISLPDLAPPTNSIVAEWCSVLEIPSIGKRFGAARVVAIDDRSVSFRVVDKETPPLRVFIAPPGHGPAYAETNRFALSYGGRFDSELTEAERDFLADLAARTRAEDARAS